MSMLDELHKLSAAEEFFETLGVDYDPAVLRVARLHILRRMGEYLRNSLSAEADDAEVLAACKAHLAAAYADFLVSSPIEQRVFKVLKDAVRPKVEREKPFVPLAALTRSIAR